jgi:hypothetical protein
VIQAWLTFSAPYVERCHKCSLGLKAEIDEELIGKPSGEHFERAHTVASEIERRSSVSAESMLGYPVAYCRPRRVDGG